MSDPTTHSPVQFFGDEGRPLPDGVRDFTPKMMSAQPGEDAPDGLVPGPESEVLSGTKKPSPGEPIVLDTREQIRAAREAAEAEYAARFAKAASDTTGAAAQDAEGSADDEGDEATPSSEPATPEPQTDEQTPAPQTSEPTKAKAAAGKANTKRARTTAKATSTPE